MATHVVHCFVGFGGTGGKTLVEFAELISQDRKWAQDAWKKMCFLLCDTDIKDLEKASVRIGKAFSHVGLKPIIKQVFLGKGATDLPAHIRGKFDNLTPAALDRLAGHWWYDKEGGGGPVDTSHLKKAVREGASQCPTVAAFLAWDRHQEIESKVDELVKELENYIAPGGAKVHLNVDLVAGLAGGTGRGCWQILGFLIRKALKDRDYDVTPTGYFLDQSCFTSIRKAGSSNQIKMEVNSLTGISEVVMWVRNEHETEKKSFEKIRHRLCNLDNPAQEESDVIEIKEGQKNDVSPIDHAWVICGASKSGTMPSPDLYYSVVAGCLYTQVASNISSDNSNKQFRVGSVGSARFEVPVNQIREFLKPKIAAQVCKDLIKVKGGADTSDLKAAYDFGGFGKLNMGQPGETEGQSGGSQSLVSGISTCFQESLTEQVTNLTENNMAKQKVKLSLDVAKEIDEQGEKLGLKACVKALSGSETTATQVSMLQEEVKVAMAARVLRSMAGGGGLANVRSRQKTLDRLLKDAEKSLRKVSNAKCGSLHNLVDSYKSRKIKHGLKVFDKTEIGDVETMAFERVAGGCLKELGSALAEACKHARTKVGSLTENVDAAINVLEERQKDYQTAVDKGEKGIFKSENELFVLKDPDAGTGSPWNSLADVYSGKEIKIDRFVKRILRPTMDDTIISNLESKLGESVQYTEAKKHVQEVLAEPTEATEGFGSDEMSSYRKRLGEAIDQMKASVVIPSKVMEDKFSLCDVVKALRKAWDEHLEKVKDPAILHSLRERCNADLGTSLTDEDAKMPEFVELLGNMVLSLAKTCDPYMKFTQSSGRHVLDSVYVSLPDTADFNTLKTKYVDLDESTKHELEDSNLGSADGEFNVETSSNPFMISIFSQENVWTEVDDITLSTKLDAIRSWKYWKSSPELLNWLKSVERESGESVHTGQGAIRLGYTDPRFVKNDTYFDKRWRPWYSDDESGPEEADLTVDAILYGLLGNTGSATSAANRISIEEAIKRIAADSPVWAVPIVQRDGKKFTLQRPSLTKKTGDLKKSDVRHSWKAGTSCGSIKQLQKFFDPSCGDAGASQHRAAMLEEADCWESIIREKYGQDVCDKMWAALADCLTDILNDAEGGSHKEEFQQCVISWMDRRNDRHA